MSDASGLHFEVNRVTGTVKIVSRAPGDKTRDDFRVVTWPAPPMSMAQRKKITAELRPLAKKVSEGVRWSNTPDGPVMRLTWSARRAQQKLERIANRRTRGARLRAWASDRLRVWASETWTSAGHMAEDLRETLDDWREHRARQAEFNPTPFQQWRADRRDTRQERDRQGSWDKAAAMGMVTPEEAEDLRAHPEHHDQAIGALHDDDRSAPDFGSGEGRVPRDVALVNAHTREGRPVRSHVRHIEGKGRRS